MHRVLTVVDAAALQRLETSRVYHTMLAQCDADLRELEEQSGVMPVAEYNAQTQAIEAERAMLKAEWEKVK